MGARMVEERPRPRHFVYSTWRVEGRFCATTTVLPGVGRWFAFSTVPEKYKDEELANHAWKFPNYEFRLVEND